MFVVGDTIKTSGIGKEEGKFVPCLIVFLVGDSCIVSKSGNYYSVNMLNTLRSSRMVLVEKTAYWFKD